MPTKNQILRKSRPTRFYKNRLASLMACPQKKGTCLKVTLISPKKPNSAVRKITRVQLSNKKKITCYIPGIGHNLQKFSSVLVRGGRVKDIPGMRYKVIRGKYDLKPVFQRRQARSKYGAKDYLKK